MTTTEEYQRDISNLNKQLANKDAEIEKLLDKIEFLEDSVMKLESIIEESNAEGDATGIARSDILEKYAESKASLELEEKDKKIRDLKNRLGYLRKEKLTLQHELDKINKDKISTSRKITVLERDTTPFDALIKDLQDKIYKQQILIKEQQKRILNDSEYDRIIKEKDREIDNLNQKINELNDYLIKVKEAQEDASESLLILIERKDNEIKTLKKQRSYPGLREEIEILKGKLEKKEREIEDHENYILSLKSSQEDANENLLALIERKQKQIENLKTQSLGTDLTDRIKKLTEKLEQEHKLNDLGDKFHK